MGLRFGGGASPHQLRLAGADNCRAGMLGMRGTVPPAVGLMKAHAEEVMSLLRAAGVADMPVGVESRKPRCSSNCRRRA